MMNLTGKYRVEITDKNGNKRFYQTKNNIVSNGIRQVLDWLSFDLYSTNSFQGFKKVSSEDVELSKSTMNNYLSAIDYDDKELSDHYYEINDSINDKKTTQNNSYATIDNTITGKQTIEFSFKEGAIMLAAIGLDAQMFSGNGGEISFDIEYLEINQVNWKKLPCNYTLINDNIRRNLTFFVCSGVPPFVFQPCCGLRFNFEIKKTSPDMVGKIYNISLLKSHNIPQPPMVMKFGSGTTIVENSNTALEDWKYSQMVSYTRRIDNNTVSYVVEIPENKCNDIKISEIGMFYRYDYVNPTHQHIKQTAKNANEIFSRALFFDQDGNPTHWEKTIGEEIVVAYDITVTNDK